MTHIGYIYIYNEVEKKGIVIDSHRYSHMFFSEEMDVFHRNQFVTYEGEGDTVEDVIPLDSYPLYKTYQKDKTFYIQDGTGSWHKYYLVNKAGERFALNGPEAFIVNRLFRGETLYPTNIIPYSEDEHKKDIQKIFESIDYVSSNLKSIADSYKVSITINHISKTGGDDRFYIDRHVDLLYRDCYINSFFLNEENLVSESGYTSHFKHSYKKGRQFEIEEKHKNIFLQNYNKNEHLLKLLYEASQKSRKRVEHEMNKIVRFAVNWGLRNQVNTGFDWEAIYYDEFEFGPSITLDSIHKFNSRGLLKME